jgi:hypothetical protein
MPCLKPVGQIIMGMDALAGAAAPEATQSCANGVVKHWRKPKATPRQLAIRAGHDEQPVCRPRRVFGHRLAGMAAALSPSRHGAFEVHERRRQEYTKKGTEKDKAFNFPMDPPTSGKDGKYFWIRQQMPPEKTFPQGFEYVLMGLVLTPGKCRDQTWKAKRRAWHAAAGRTDCQCLGRRGHGDVHAGGQAAIGSVVVVVTTMDGPDVLAEARKRLAAAEAAGFDGVLRENTHWWNAFYDKRENGRGFQGPDRQPVHGRHQEHLPQLRRRHGGGTHTDMRQYECSAMYVPPERDAQLWSSAPCYNEVFTSNRFVRNWADNQQMWKQLVWHWMPGGKDNAKNLFGMPGMAILHGYQPPVKPDKIVHTTLTLEFCLETMAQIIKPVWDEWDYGGDIEFLRKECYPLMREMALFYAAYAKKGDDGYYHIIPSMEPEKWGWYAEFARNKDVISSLCMFRWALNRAAEAAEILGVDADLRGQWREVADNLAPYPTWDTPDGPMYCAIAGVEPKHVPGDHFGEAAEYPTILADEINLDSPKEQRT